MTAKSLMNEFPPAQDRLVTLANWRTQPFNDWSYRNVRRLLPTADIPASRTPSQLAYALQDIGDVSFKDPDGKTIPLTAWLRGTRTNAFLVMRQGRVVMEWYGEGMNGTTPHIVFSVSKSICGALGGVLVERGILDPDRPVTDYIPEVGASVYGTKGCTVRHLLDMSVGIKFEEDYLDPNGDVARYRRAVGWDVTPPGQPLIDLRGFLAMQKPDGANHGETFHYVSTNTDTLGWVYERATGRALSDLLSEHLWQPMGAETDAYITLDSHGAMRAAGGICAAPRDLVRFGEIIRCRGVVDGRQVVPGTWIDDINENGSAEGWARGDFAEIFPGGHYRSKFYQIDRKRRTLACLGIHGQYIYIDPPSETVIVRVGSDHTPLDVPATQTWRRSFDAIAAHLS
jgi:CubicO group peptidase (beta-lactamase class C family)